MCDTEYSNNEFRESINLKKKCHYPGCHSDIRTWLYEVDRRKRISSFVQRYCLEGRPEVLYFSGK